MNNDNLKKTITKIVAMAILEADELPFVETAEYVASELISAGIGKMKTCKNESNNNPVDEFICSECGFMTEDFSEKRVDMDDGEVTYHEFEFRYCPNCGAKVVEESK
jgi:predicted RNA-binding Zn-ribbon protein involved in translation (DUF1610 family)